MGAFVFSICFPLRFYFYYTEIDGGSVGEVKM